MYMNPYQQVVDRQRWYCSCNYLNRRFSKRLKLHFLAIVSVKSSAGIRIICGLSIEFILILYKINDNLSLCLGYRYLKQDYTVLYLGTDYSVKFSLNNNQQVYLGVDYRF